MSPPSQRRQSGLCREQPRMPRVTNGVLSVLCYGIWQDDYVAKGKTVMGTVKRWLKRVETRTLVWLARSRISSFVMVGTLAAAGLGVAALGGQSTTIAQQGQSTIGSAIMPLSTYGCSSDPDGDGHIFCDSSVAISSLPASFGQCHADEDGDMLIICRGSDTDTGW